MVRAVAKPIICPREFDGFGFALPLLRARLYPSYGLTIRHFENRMSKDSKFTFVVRNSGRSASDDDWQRIEPAHIEVWRSVIQDDTSYTVAFDWWPIVRRHERHYSAMSYIYTRRDISLDKRLRTANFPRRPSRNTICVSTKGKKPRASLYVVQSIIHDIFLIMNIAAPGCCDFYRASLLGDESIEPDVSLSNYQFEAALLVHVSNKWPVPRILDLSKVIIWFDAVREGAIQMPRNAMERVLFALLHISKLDTSPMAVIWLFYAFESLLQTRVGENFSAITRRLILLLDADKQQAELLKKKVRVLYDIRSAIVHGGFEVTHPMHNGALDRRVDDSFADLLQALNYGYALLLASIQKTIEQSWLFPYFDETVRGDAIQ
jgi:hypothetical protein